MQQNSTKRPLYRGKDILQSLLGIVIVIPMAIFIASFVP